MKTLLKKWCGWLTTSNRTHHIEAGFIVAALFGIVPTIIAALAVEFKDWQWNGGKGWPVAKNGFDWLDVAATLIGGILGVVMALLLVPEKFSILTGFF